MCLSCGHECCKSGVLVKVAPSSKKAPPPQSTSLDSCKRRGSNPIGDYLNELHARANSLPETPVALKRLKVSTAYITHTPDTCIQVICATQYGLCTTEHGLQFVA